MACAKVGCSGFLNRKIQEGVEHGEGKGVGKEKDSFSMISSRTGKAWRENRDLV